MERYRKINVDAQRPEDVYPEGQAVAVAKNVSFFRTCLRAFPVLHLAQRDDGRIYACFEHGRLVFRDMDALAAIADAVTLEALNAVAPVLLVRDANPSAAEPRRYLDPARYVTLGRWRGSGS